jgi:protein phosphatase 1 regulatory subunit 7
MSIIFVDGFKIYVGRGKKSIIINSDNIDECMQVYNENHLDGVAITTSHHYRLQDVDFLAEYPEIEHISISEGIDNINAIHTLPNLKSMIMSGKNRKLDFSFFPSLTNLTIDWSPYLLNMDKCKQLRHLFLYNYVPKTKNCSDISNVTWVKKLGITQSSISTLAGLEKFDQLEELEFNYCSKLDTLCCLDKSKETLVSLLFDHCKSIKNHEYATQFSHLNTLAHNNGGIIPSIKFIRKMKSLKSFRFVGTDVVDGDISPCIGLEYAGFSNKKHFSHTMEQIKSYLTV